MDYSHLPNSRANSHLGIRGNLGQLVRAGQASRASAHDDDVRL